LTRIEKTVFISYRRTNAPWALAIFQDLKYNGYDAFFDFQGIASGDFERVILENVRARAHFLILLTPSALERCGERGDWLRREIETAMDTRRNIAPLMLDNFDFTAPSIVSQLTGQLAALKDYNGLRCPGRLFPGGHGPAAREILECAVRGCIAPRLGIRAASRESPTGRRHRGSCCRSRRADGAGVVREGIRGRRLG
jgi:TIR domain